MLYEFKQGKNAIVATKNITHVYGNDSLDVRKFQRWFTKFRTGDLSLEDDQCSGQPVGFDEDALSALVDAEPYLSNKEFAKKLNLTSSTVHQHLKAFGKISKLRKWVLHEFNSNLSQCLNICSSLIGRQELGGFAASTLFSRSGSADYHFF
jgi:histone-lysine N-methyltransferase SETMAR